MADPLRITPSQDGPYLVEGAGAIMRMRDGEPIPAEDKVALCRCGGSQNPLHEPTLECT